MDGKGLIGAVERDYARLSARCEAFDRELTADLTSVGGAGYAALASLAYRQLSPPRKWSPTPRASP